MTKGAPRVAGILAAAPKDAHLYCCGPTPMLNVFEAATKDWPRAQIHVEYFTPKQEPVKARGGFTVELARSGQEFFIPEGRSILEVLLDEGVDVDYSCELGICGACEQRIISGIAEHHDSILSEEEQAENKRVMICCAGSKSERLVLDVNCQGVLNEGIPCTWVTERCTAFPPRGEGRGKGGRDLSTRHCFRSAIRKPQLAVLFSGL
jgi:ferredoxin